MPAQESLKKAFYSPSQGQEYSGVLYPYSLSLNGKTLTLSILMDSLMDPPESVCKIYRGEALFYAIHCYSSYPGYPLLLLKIWSK